MKFDQTDRSILNLLQENARMTIKELSAELGLSTTPIFERIKRLEREGVIERYVALLNKSKIDRPLLAILQVSLKEHSKELVDKFDDLINGFPEVIECYRVTGESDFFMKVAVKDMRDYNDFVLSKMASVPNVAKVHSQFALSTNKYTTKFEL